MTQPDSPFRLLLFNLATDADDPILGFTTAWLNRIAAHCESVDVVTMRAGRLDLAPNVRVYSIGKERGHGEARRAIEFYRILACLLLTRRYDACFAHMMPLFVALGAPLLRARGVPVTLWYTHRQVTRQLRLALRVSRRVVSAAPDSFPIPTSKLRPLGHGIDPKFFAPDAETAPETGSVVHVARLMPIKHQETLLRALAQVEEARAVFVGGVPPQQDTAYRDKLDSLASELGVSERVTFTGDLPAREVREQYRRAALAVNLSPPGLLDKAALESMASATPTIVSNPAFDALLGQHVALLRIDAPEDADGLAENLLALLALTAPERAAIGAQVRARVVEQHSLDRLIPRLMNVLRTGEVAEEVINGE